MTEQQLFDWSRRAGNTRCSVVLVLTLRPVGPMVLHAVWHNTCMRHGNQYQPTSFGEDENQPFTRVEGVEICTRDEGSPSLQVWSGRPRPLPLVLVLRFLNPAPPKATGSLPVS